MVRRAAPVKIGPPQDRSSSVGLTKFAQVMTRWDFGRPKLQSQPLLQTLSKYIHRFVKFGPKRARANHISEPKKTEIKPGDAGFLVACI